MPRCYSPGCMPVGWRTPAAKTAPARHVHPEAGQGRVARTASACDGGSVWALHRAGVTAEDLAGVTATAADAQRAVARLLRAQRIGASGGRSGRGSGGFRPVVLVGHALHHDLKV